MSHSGQHFLCCWTVAEKQNLHWTPGNGVRKYNLVFCFTFKHHPPAALCGSHLSLFQALFPAFLFQVESCLVLSCWHLFSWNKPSWFCCAIFSLTYTFKNYQIFCFMVTLPQVSRFPFCRARQEGEHPCSVLAGPQNPEWSERISNLS